MAKEYGDIEQLVNDVTSLDTARMTLRWALERLNTIEKEKADLKKNLTLAEEASKKLQLKEATLTDAYTSRTKTLEEKEDFYTKLEATMSLLGEGKLDIQQLLKKEAKLDSLRHSLESEYSDKFEELDRNQRAVIERWNSRLLEVEGQYAGRLAEAQKKYDGLRAEVESGYQGRLNALQASFKAREKELSERIGGLESSVRMSEEKVEARRRELEAEYLAKKREAEENYRKLRNMLEAGLEEKIRAMDSDHAEQVRSFESSWQIERARLLEEQRVREDQFNAAQDRIKSIENTLAAQQEIHHSELLKIISEKETAFRAQLVKLENEKAAKESTVRELQARLEKKADVWEADRSRLQSEFDGRLSSMEAGLRERAASLETEYSAKKAEIEKTIAASREEFRKEFDATLLTERRAMDAEKSRLEWEKREREEALALNTKRLIELENALAATREEHHRDLMERIRTGEASFRDKLAGFEAEKQAYNETINKLTDEIRLKENSILAEKEKIAAEFDAKAALYEERLARTEGAFEEKRLSYEGKIAALLLKLEEAYRASALEKENFKNGIARISEEAEALAEERAAGIRADYEARKAELEKEFAARYGDRLKALEAEKARMNEAMTEREGQLKASYSKAAELDGALAAMRRASSEEKDALIREHAVEIKREQKAAAEDARAREAELCADINVLRSELVEKDRLLSQEREKLADELSKASAEAHNRTEERAAAIRSEYEGRLAALEAEADSRIQELKGMLGEKEAMFEKYAQERAAAEKVLKWDFERRISELEAEISVKAAAMEADYEGLREKLEAETAARAGALNAEAAEKIEFERKNWHAERARFEDVLVETSENFDLSQKQIQALNARLHQAAEENIAREARFNRELMDVRSGYEKEILSRIKESVAAQTADLVDALEAARDNQAELSASLKEKDSDISALKSEAAEARRDCEIRMMSAVSEAVAARRSELEKAFARRQAALEGDCQARSSALAGEFSLKSARLEEENALLKAEFEKASAVAAEAGAKAAELAGKLLAAEKAFHAEKLEMQKAQTTEFDSALSDAVAVAVDAAERKLHHVQEELAKAQKANMDEVLLMEEAFAGEKDRLQEEIDRRDRYIESADEKMQKFEHEMMEYRQAASGELLKNISEQDGRFREMAAEEKARSEARIKQLENLLSAKEKLLAEGDRFYRQKQMELDSLHSGLNMRENKFNEELFTQKQELGEKEKALNEYRLKLEKDYALKASELEQMKAELTRAIMDYRKK